MNESDEGEVSPKRGYPWPASQGSVGGEGARYSAAAVGSSPLVTQKD